VTWTWRLETEADTEVPAVPIAAHADQPDAESWLQENWQDLAAAGVRAVSLFEDDERVYGPMPLAEF